MIKLPDEAEKIIKQMEKAGFTCYAVGGSVRDYLMGRKTANWDFTTDATPQQIQEVFPDSYYENQFGTVGIPIKAQSEEKELYEITTYRTECGYSDKRHPDKVCWGTSLEEDLARRDFTINAIAIDGEKIIDPYNGSLDLKNKILRAVRNPAERFSEDALRMMRAIRIATELEFIIEPDTFSAIKQSAILIKQISQERIRDELIKILKSDHPADGMLLLHNSGLLIQIMPEIEKGYGLAQAGHHIYDVFKHSLESLRFCPSKNWLVRLATFLHDLGKPAVVSYNRLAENSGIYARDEGKRLHTSSASFGKKLKEPSFPQDSLNLTKKTPAFQAGEVYKNNKPTFYNHEVAGAIMVSNIARRLHFKNEDREKLYILIRWHMFSVSEFLTDSAVRRFIRRVGKENVNDIMDLRIGDRLGGGCLTETSWRLRQLQKRVIEVQKHIPSVSDLKIDGCQVMKILNIKPGPKVGQILNQLFEEILEEPKKNTEEYLQKRVREL